MIRFVLAVLAALLTAPALAQAPEYGPGAVPPLAGTPGNIASFKNGGLAGDSLIPTSSIAIAASSARAPRQTDNAAAGYGLGNLWLAPQGDMWSAQRVAGNAVWQRMGVSARLMNAGLPAPAAAYGVCRLSASYAGSPLQLTRASDSTTLAIGFNAATNCVDGPAGDAFCAGTTCAITTWYDQSGSGYNATAAAANAPIWNAAATIKGNRVIQFASVAHAISNLPLLQQYLQIPSGLSWNPGSVTWLAVGQVIASRSTEVRTIFQTADGSRGWLNTYNGSGLAAIGQGVSCPGVLDDGASVFGVTTGSSLMTCYSGNSASSVAYTAQSSFTGGYIGSSSTTWPADMDLQAFVVWTTPLTASQTAAAQAVLSEQFNIPLQADDILVIAGDSMSMGEGSSADNSWPKLVLPQLNYTTRLFNASIFGDTLVAGIIPNIAYITGIYANIGAHNFDVILLAGANDIRTSVPIATIEAGFKTFIQDVHNLGANARVLIATYPLQCDIYGTPASNSELQAMNNYIYTNWAIPQASGGLGADGLVDFFGDPEIGPGVYTGSNFCSNTANSPDGQHPTDYFMSFYAPIAAGAINSLSR